MYTIGVIQSKIVEQRAKGRKVGQEEEIINLPKKFLFGSFIAVTSRYYNHSVLTPEHCKIYAACTTVSWKDLLILQLIFLKMVVAIALKPLSRSSHPGIQVFTSWQHMIEYLQKYLIKNVVGFLNSNKDF